MWRTFFLTFYILPNLYIFLRLGRLLAGNRRRRLILSAYFLWVLVFPLVEILGRDHEAGWTRSIQTAGYYGLPYLLYLFLLLIVCDLLTGLNRLLKVIPREKMLGRRFRAVCLAVVLSVPLVIEGYGILHFRQIRINPYAIQIARKGSSIEHLRIALAADFHLQDATAKTFMLAFVKKVNALNADLVLLPGDLREGHGDNQRESEFERQFRQIKAKYGVYAVFGNHEWHGGNNSQTFFNRAGIRVLQDQAIVIDRAFYLAGRNDDHSQNRKSLDELLQQMPEDLPIILLDHRPLGLAEVGRSKVDIQVSGHTHNGQLFPFNFITRAVYELSWGHKQIGNTHFFVTSGIRTWGPPVRTVGDSEIMLIEVDFK
jgi:predicted MPP superfamily phosphohydrolase